MPVTFRQRKHGTVFHVLDGSQPQPMEAEVHYDRKRLIAPGETITFGFDLTDRLASGETLTAIDTALTEDPASDDVTVAAASINASTFEDDDGATVAIGKGVQVAITIADDAEDADYEIEGLATTSDSNTVGVFGGINVRSS